MHFDKLWQEVCTLKCSSYLVFSSRSVNEMGDIFSDSPLQRWQEASTQCPLLILVQLGQVRYCNHALSVFRPSLTFHIFDFSSEPMKVIQWSLTGSKISTSSTKFVFFLQDDQKTKMAAPAFDWLRHFRLLISNRWTEFNETWQETRYQRLLPSLCFSDRSENQNGRRGLWLADTFSTSPLKLLNGIQWNLTGSKNSTSSTKLAYYGPIRKPRPLCQQRILNCTHM